MNFSFNTYKNQIQIRALPPTRAVEKEQPDSMVLTALERTEELDKLKMGKGLKYIQVMIP